MTTATVEKTPEVDLAAEREDAIRQVQELAERIAHAAPEAISDATVAAEVADWESQRAAAERRVRQIGEADAESTRRSEQRAREQEQKRIAGLLRKAEALQPKIEAAARAYDDAADAVARAHAEHHRLMVEQTALLTQAGAGPAPGHQWAWISRYTAALSHALLNRPDGSAIAAVYTSGGWASPKPLATASGEPNKGE